MTDIWDYMFIVIKPGEITLIKLTNLVKLHEDAGWERTPDSPIMNGIHGGINFRRLRGNAPE